MYAVGFHCTNYIKTKYDKLLKPMHEILSIILTYIMEQINIIAKRESITSKCSTATL